MILGTAAYMSPEQAQGKPVDKRADIWAFGVVLYEMLTGRRLFQGETVSDTLAAVLTKEPEWERVPTQVRRLLRRCLEKDPQKRLRDISGVGLLLEETPQAAGPRHSRVPWVAASVLAIVAAVALWIAWRATRPVDRPLMRFSVDLGPEAVEGSRVLPHHRHLARRRAGWHLWRAALGENSSSPRGCWTRPRPHCYRGRRMPSTLLLARRAVDRVLRGWKDEEDFRSGRRGRHALRRTAASGRAAPVGAKTARSSSTLDQSWRRPFAGTGGGRDSAGAHQARRERRSRTSLAANPAWRPGRALHRQPRSAGILRMPASRSFR